MHLQNKFDHQIRIIFQTDKLLQLKISMENNVCLFILQLILPNSSKSKFYQIFQNALTLFGLPADEIIFE